tara:strand:+ start:879 stop:1199 length:321 start_codon:yes stop_codon:yes gene_type:complete
MKRLIDDKETIVAMRLELYKLANSEVMFNRLIEELYAPIAEWYDKLDPEDNKTWVLCFVSDSSPTSREYAEWVASCVSGPYPFICGFGHEYKYATPVDLSIRYEVQ